MALSLLRRAATIAVFGATTLLPASRLAAQQSFFFQFTSGATSASGNLSAHSNGNGTFTATSGTGSVTGAAANGTFTLFGNPSAPGCANSGPFNYDNQLNPTGNPLISYCGLLFTMDNGGQQLNIYAMSNNTGSPYELDEAINGYDSHPNGTFTLTTTPEPGSMALLGTGLMGLVPLVRRKRKIG
ncbi:MAG TPA: PEP-CTERM sorting domain-containing protein [Gemmatimonadaceae bacterium]